MAKILCFLGLRTFSRLGAHMLAVTSDKDGAGSTLLILSLVPGLVAVAAATASVAPRAHSRMVEPREQ